MAIRTALAAVAVFDLGEAKEYYARLFGRPADIEPMPTLAQWDLASGGVQVVEKPDGHGSSMLTLLVDDFDLMVTTLTDEGFAPGEVVDGVISRVVQVEDPAGNVITFAEIVD